MAETPDRECGPVEDRRMKTALLLFWYMIEFTVREWFRTHFPRKD